MLLDLLGQGVEIAVLGMTAVYILLGILVFALHAMSRLAASLEPAESSSLAPSGVPDKVELTVAVTAAIHAHRRRWR